MASSGPPQPNRKHDPHKPDQSDPPPPRSVKQVHPMRQAAHDLRNVLNVIRNVNYLLRRKLTALGGDGVDLVDMIDAEVKSAETIASNLMESASAPEPIPERNPV